MSPRRLLAASGQASVELVALLPLVALVAALAWQAVVAGQAIWLSGSAARAAARASALGTDPTSAARAALPGSLAPGAHASSGASGSASVSLAIPAVVGHARLATIHARARFAPQQEASR
jgi:hypothetical protein